MSEGDRASKRTMTANQKAVVKAESSEAYFERNVEQAVVSAVIQAAAPSRRRFLASMGAAALTAFVAELLPLKEFAAFAADPVGKPEKTDLSIGFIPITCATPIIMAEQTLVLGHGGATAERQDRASGGGAKQQSHGLESAALAGGNGCAVAHSTAFSNNRRNPAS